MSVGCLGICLDLNSLEKGWKKLLPSSIGHSGEMGGKTKRKNSKNKQKTSEPSFYRIDILAKEIST